MLLGQALFAFFQLIQFDEFLLIGVDEALSLSLEAIELRVDASQLGLELSLIGLLDVLVEEIFLGEGFGVLEELA